MQLVSARAVFLCTGRANAAHWPPRNDRPQGRRVSVDARKTGEVDAQVMDGEALWAANQAGRERAMAERPAQRWSSTSTAAFGMLRHWNGG
jgi:hypothetical protein